MPTSAKDSFSTVYEDDCVDNYFDINDCYNYEGNFDYDRLEDAILDGEYVLDDW